MKEYSIIHINMRVINHTEGNFETEVNYFYLSIDNRGNREKNRYKHRMD